MIKVFGKTPDLSHLTPEKRNEIIWQTERRVKEMRKDMKKAKKQRISAADKSSLRISAVAVMLALAILFLMTGCQSGPGYFYAKAGVGDSGMWLQPDGNDWDDAGGTGAKLGAGYRYQISGPWHGEIAYDHHSQWEVGPPFDNEPETETDHIFYSVEYHFGVSP